MESGEEKRGESDNERKEEIVVSTLLWLKPGAIRRELTEDLTEGSWREGRLGLGASIMKRNQSVFTEEFLLIGL